MMNHTRIAAEALRFRLGTLTQVGGPSTVLDVEEAAELVVACADPGVDRALRLVGETWHAAGLPTNAIAQPWTPGATARLRNVGGGNLLDALDDLVTGIGRCQVRP